MRAILVCQNFADVLALTLPYNRHHFEEVYVVTSSRDCDLPVKDIAGRCDAKAVTTDVFWDQGAAFNKWGAMEAGLDVMKREGWICVMDVDIVWPHFAKYRCHPGRLYTPRRRICAQIPESIPAENQWDQFPIDNRMPAHFSGYTQIFHAGDPRAARPWFGRWGHDASTADSLFQKRWPAARKVRPSFEVLHLGEICKHWKGRVETMERAADVGLVR